MKTPSAAHLNGSTKRTSRGGWVNLDKMQKGPGGRNRCRRCGTEVPIGRLTFCSKECVHEWKLRTNPGYLREATWKRDKGVCADCGIATVPEPRKRMPWRGTGHLWHADHIVPVIEGGGECGLENIRTLCRECHRKATAELRRRIAEARRSYPLLEVT